MISNESPAVNAQGQVDFAHYWAVVVKHHRLIIVCVVVAALIGAVVSLLAKPLYKATVVLNVERDQSTPFDVAGQQTYQSFDPEFIPTQTRLMTSRGVAEHAVERYHLQDNPEILAPVSGLLRRSTDAASQRVNAAANVVRGGIAAVPVRGTNLIELSYISMSPKLAADIANAVADAYIDWTLESKYLMLNQASRFIGTQIEQLKSEIQQKERQFQAYGRQKDIISMEGPSNVTVQKLSSLNNDYANAVADRVGKEAKYYELQQARADTAADMIAGPFITQLRNDQARLERDYAEKLNLYKPEWPAMQQLRIQIEKGRQHLGTVIEENAAKARDAAYTDYMTAARREQSLKAVLQGQKSEAMALNSNAVEYNNLKTEIETKRTLLDALLKRQAETEVNSRLRGERVSNIRVVDRALPPTTRFSPSYKKNALTSLFLGLAAGLALAFGLEYLDRTLRTTEQVESLLRLPALGIIPALDAKASGGGYGYGYGYGDSELHKERDTLRKRVQIELLPHSEPRSSVAEAYRAFRAGLLLSRAGGLKTMVITSSLPSEGKTSTAANLAIVLGQLGKKVLLIDADLHKPRLHEILKVSNRIGLVSVLAENLDSAAAIIRTNVPNVWITPSGPISPNPSGLLSSDAMVKFLGDAAANFDFVVIDTPPVGPVADAMVVGSLVDGVVLCVKGGKTPREVVARTRDQLARSNNRVLGVLINNLDERAYGYGSYYNYYAGVAPVYGEQATSRSAAS